MASVALVTGASRGIGLATARLLTRHGIATIFAMRNPDDAADTVAALGEEGRRCALLALDICDSASIAAAANDVAATFGRLDILVNNAAVMIDDPTLPPSAQSLDTWRQTLETNLLGTIAVTRALLPLIRTARAGRIVNVSSSGGSLGMHSDPETDVYPHKLPAYGASKAALNAWTIHLAYELRDTPIKVNAIQPGNTCTSLNPHGVLTPDEAAETCLRFALLDADGPHGGFFDADGRLPW